MMIDFESYNNNLDITDKNGVDNLPVSRKVIYCGPVNKIKKTTSDESENARKPLAASVIGLNNTALTDQGIPENVDLWTEHDVQELFLDSKPTCYLILGKPGSGAYTLGEAIAKKYQCIHLCPKNVLMDEIERGSQTGNCLVYNLKHKKVIKQKTILSIIKKKLESAVVQHRGYVLSGFPLVSSNISSQYFTNTLYSEEALDVIQGLLLDDVLANLTKKKPKVLRTESSSISSDTKSGVEEEVEEEIEEEQITEETEEPAVDLPKFLLDACANIVVPEKVQMFSHKIVLLEQLNEAFNLAIKPDIIIFFTCPDKDLVTKRNHKYYNFSNDIFTFDQLITITPSEVRWPTKYQLSDYVSPYDKHIFNPKYNCKHPINFERNSINQICNYKQHVSQFIEHKLKDYDPKFIIKVPAYSSIHETMHQLTERLDFLCIKPVLIPKPLFVDNPPEDVDDFWSSISEMNVVKSGFLNFNRCPSLWFNRCPIELQMRRSIQGLPKYAVSLFKHIYLISSLNALISFCKNPRPYLKLKYLEPTCRVFVTGTKSSGKTMLSKCLSWLFDAPIISYDEFLQKERHKKHCMYSKTILSEIIPTIEDARHLIWQNRESERKSKLNAWLLKTSNALKTYIPILLEILKVSNRSLVTELTDEEQETKSGSEIELLENYKRLRSLIAFLPFLDDVEKCIKVLQDESLVTFAPSDISTPTERPNTPVLGDEDVIDAIENYIKTNELQNEIEPTNDELMSEFASIILNIDKETQEKYNHYGKFVVDGFPSEPEKWDYFTDINLLPDYTIVLLETRELDLVLINNYKKVESSIKNYQERFVLANDPFIVTKMQTTILSDTNNIDIQIIIHDIFNNIFVYVEEAHVEEANDEADLITNLNTAIEKFREDWDSIKLKLEEKNKCHIEVNLESKTDIQVIEEVLLKLRSCYYLTCEVTEDEQPEPIDEGDEHSKDMIAYNDPRNLCETGIYCPITYNDRCVLWEGKPELCVKYNNKIHFFSKEEYLELFQRDVTRFQSYNQPFKRLPPLRLCIVGCIGSGKSSVSKMVAKELGLIHVDFSEFINNLLIPRHFKKVGRQYENIFTDTPIDDSGVSEFQMDEENENIIDDILSNEKEIRRMVFNYFERGTPILTILMQKVITKLWFELPFKESGVVIDGYPRIPTDVEDMVSFNCIPDLIIELEGNIEISLQRLSDKTYKTWKSQLKEAKEISMKKFENEKRDWAEFITKNVVAKLILEDVLDEVFPTIYQETDHLSTGSTIIEPHPQGSKNVEANLFNIYNDMVQEYPAPTDQNEWESSNEARERIDARIEGIFEIEDEGLQSLKDVVAEQRIKLLPLNSTKPLNKLLKLILFNLTNLRNRNESFFEQTYIINYDIAEMLLTEGLYFFSKYGRMCPVYIYENPHAIINPYKIMKRKDQLFPVIHRSNIYFIFGKDSLYKFRLNPLKYITHDSMKSFKEYPITIGVIGPPKSGKSVLSQKLAKRYGLMCISKGKALRFMLQSLYWTELSCRMKNALVNGECIKSDYIMEAVHTVAIEHRTATYGFVFDGLPESASEAMELVKFGLYPTVIIDISSETKKVMENSQNEIYYDIIKMKPPYSAAFIEYRYTEWNKRKYNIRNWIRDDYQNLYVVDGKKSKWQCYQNVVDHVEELSSKIHHYLINVTETIVPAYFMGISNAIFQERMSNFKDMCPLCLKGKVLRHSGYPVDKKGIVQFQNKFYWICAGHIDLVLKFPQDLLMDKVDIPEIPAVVQTVNSSLVYENGICIVTYASTLPAQKIVSGSNKYAASFRGKTYLFCDSKCLDKFMSKPDLYCDIVVLKTKNMFPQLTLKKLPNIGYLEQTLANIITDACCLVNVVRPKYPGLSLKVSALLYIALYLKTHNPKIDGESLALYKRIFKIYDRKCKVITDVRLRLRSMDNPFAKYPKCCHTLDPGTVNKPSISNDDTTTSRVPVPDERFDYLCEYHKPASKVPAFLNVVDIAGLVKGAAEGQGLGNAFLSHIKACDAIFNLCRAFDDEDVIHVDGEVNPVRDLETIGEELRLKDEEQLMQNIEKLDRAVNRGNDKKLKPEYDSLLKIKTVLVDEKKHIRFGDWSAADIEVLNKYLFLTSKPALYLVNLSEKDYIRKKNKWLPKLKEWIDKNDPGAPLIPFSGVLESKLMDMDPEERKAYLKEHNITSALDKIIVQGYKALQLEYFFTAGPDEVKAWTIQKGTKAPQAAGRIHTDFEKGFIMAEVMHFKDFKEEGTEAACKAAGKYRQQGRNYVVEDGDIIFFKFNAGAGLKDAKKK